MILQTAINRLKQRQAQFGFEAKKSLGQNFLINDGVITKIIKSLDVIQVDHLIEIGPGLGALTDPLVQLNKVLTVVELDKRFADYWRNQGVTVIEGDALKISWDLFRAPYVLVSNLPYQISSSVVVDRSIDDTHRCRQMVLMFQKEVAQRLNALAGSSAYGFLSVLAQTFWDLKILCDAGPKDFYPPPRVASRVLSFYPRDSVRIEDRAAYLYFLKASFLHPRKMIVRNWQQGLSLNRALGQNFLIQEGLKETVRPHEITVEQFMNLYQKWKSR
jgi:16S rRNA (adenine1518-N6/adenine1519-N6)-dimethyltransferase